MEQKELCILPVEYKDCLALKKVLQGTKSLNTNQVLQEMISHLYSKDSYAIKLIDKNTEEVLGVWFSKEFEEYISLSFFYIFPKIRRHIEVLEFFNYCRRLSEDKPILINSKDISGFERYVTQIDEDTYQLVGFR